MKIRTGFVSNSSSSSFLIYGTVIENGELDDVENYYDYLEEKTKDTDLTVISAPDNECFYIGKSWSKVGDDQTGKQFKDEIEKQLRESGLLKEGKACYTYEEAWYG